MSFLLRFKIGFRIGLRSKLGPCVSADAHDQVYLRQFPWLFKIIPVGMDICPSSVDESGKRHGGVVVKRLDETFAGQRLHCGRGAYLVDKSGNIVKRLGDFLTDYTWDRVLRGILSLPSPNEISFVVCVYGRNDAGRIEIFKMPRDWEVQSFALAIFHRSEEARTKAKEEQQRRREAAAQQALQEIKSALQD